MLILASASPRRKELLKKVAPSFLVIPSNYDERSLHLSAEALAKEESKMKAYEVFSRYPNEEILSCDTIVVLHGQVLGKPKDEQEAIRMLLAEQGQTQTVLSGYTYIRKGKEISRTVATKVHFNHLSEAQIKEYVLTKKPLDKAGAYGIQDDFPLISYIEGSYDNVMGLPTEDLLLHVKPFLRRE